MWSARGTNASLGAFFTGLPEMADYFRKLLPSAEKPWPLAYLPEIQKRLLETVKIALAATFVGSLLALPFTLVSTRNLAAGRWVYNLGRGTLNLLRTIPDIVLAAILAAIFGIGALPGLLALIFFTFGVVARSLQSGLATQP